MSCVAQKTKEGRILSMPGVTIFTFSDGSHSVIIGLNKVLTAIYDEGRPINFHTARKIVRKVAKTHYIDTSVRQWYCDLLLEEYRKYFDVQVRASQTDNTAQYVPDDGLGLIGVLWKLLFMVFPPSHPWSPSTR